MNVKYFVDSDIAKAETLPASFYHDEDVFELLKEQVFTKSWQFINHDGVLPFSDSVYPFYFLENFIDEPMLLVRMQSDQIKCLSNVCTHRGNIIIHYPSKNKSLQCLYHGRKFDKEGRFRHMPEFDGAIDFPRPCDDLHTFELHRWNQFIYVAPSPTFNLSIVLSKIEERVSFLPINEMKHDPSRSKDYIVNAHWALYCDNYLEGFHIPFVHADLNQVLDYGEYKTEIHEYSNLQIGYTEGGSHVFNLPKDHIDYGKNVAAYYYWVFPNMMFNFYPWGLSINVVKPITKNRTRVSFISYVLDEAKLETGAGALLDKVEREDEFVVEGVFRGLKSKYYQKGRFSPKREQGVHHFHMLLAEALQ